MSAAARFWGLDKPYGFVTQGYPATPPRTMSNWRARQFAGKRSRTMAFGQGGFARRVRGRSNGGRMRGRYAGFYRKSGYFGRFSPSVRGDQGPELKFYDLDVDDAIIAATGTIQTPTNPGPAAAQASLNGIKQGTGENERIGRKCTIRNIAWRWQCFLPEQDSVTVVENNDLCRLIVYLDKQCNGAAATVTGILESADYQSFNNLANKSRFRVLHDKQVVMNYLAMAGDGTTHDTSAVFRCGTWFKKCNIPLEFDDSSTDGSLTSIRSNNVGMLFISANGTMGIASKVRLRFSDN